MKLYKTQFRGREKTTCLPSQKLIRLPDRSLMDNPHSDFSNTN